MPSALLLAIKHVFNVLKLSYEALFFGQASSIVSNDNYIHCSCYSQGFDTMLSLLELFIT